MKALPHIACQSPDGSFLSSERSVWYVKAFYHLWCSHISKLLSISIAHIWLLWFNQHLAKLEKLQKWNIVCLFRAFPLSAPRLNLNLLTLNSERYRNDQKTKKKLKGSRVAKTKYLFMYMHRSCWSPWFTQHAGAVY